MLQIHAKGQQAQAKQTEEEKKLARGLIKPVDQALHAVSAVGFAQHLTRG